MGQGRCHGVNYLKIKILTMKKLELNLIYIVIFWLSCSCGSSPIDIKQRTLLKISITDKTLLHYYMNNAKIKDTTISDANTLAECKLHLDGMKEVNGISQKKNVGYYELKLYYSDKSIQTLDLLYTVYDGVVICDNLNNREYRNESMEQFISHIFRKQPFR